ncbi:beta-ketoacyl synthase N-terminal-like domain-containing protein [Microbacterium sp. 16-032]|jgi:3-oxoacyl-[acyl-carrier-protein] synthase II|uniref:beta-ketoacyl synthase N-terminal-like domain-containing protein n=1 Tax=Microbacterium sp. 16-032 TaxID=3239808 RepID=UPI0034E218E7
MNEPLLITGVGAVSTLGLSATDHTNADEGWVFPNVETAEATSPGPTGHSLREVSAGFRIQDYVTSVGLRRKQRFSHLATAAAVDAFAAAQLAERPADLERIGIVANTEYGPQRVVSAYLDGLVGGGLVNASPGLFTQTVYNVANGQASLALGLKGANSTLVGGSAVAYGVQLIETGKADAIFAMSLDETNEIMTDYFDAAAPELDRELPFATGEAAAVVVLESAGSAGQRGAEPIAHVLGLSLASATGAGVSYLDWAEEDDTIAYAMRAALDDAGVAVGDVDIVVGTANGLGAITRNEFAAIRGIGYRGPLALPRLATGECYGGNEALAHVLALSAAEPGQTLLVTVSTVNGGVTSAVVRKA